MKLGYTLGLVLTLAVGANASTILLHSGNGPVPGTDSDIHFLLGPASTDFPSPLTPADFAAAQVGPLASIIVNHPAWIATLPADPAARWISDNPNGATVAGNTALYAISFFLPFAISSASINVNYAVDNNLGLTQDGIYINGTGVVPPPTPGSFTSQLNYTNAGVGQMLHQGVNWLYFDAVNTGGPAGFIFSATINTVDAVPEPASLTLFGGALIAIAACRRRLLQR